MDRGQRPMYIFFYHLKTSTALSHTRDGPGPSRLHAECFRHPEMLVDAGDRPSAACASPRTVAELSRVRGSGCGRPSLSPCRCWSGSWGDSAPRVRPGAGACLCHHPEPLTEKSGKARARTQGLGRV